MPPAAVREVDADQLLDDPPDLVLLQRIDDVESTRTTLGRTPGQDRPAFVIELAGRG